MKKYLVTTPENIEIEYELAGVGSRTAAAVIDLLIQTLMTVILGIILLLVYAFSGKLSKEYYGWIIGISIIIFALITYGYYIYMEITKNGQTIGKKIFSLRTIRNNGEPITLKHSAIRNLFRVFIDMYGVGIVLMFFSKNNKRLGDMVASTIVVCESNKDIPIPIVEDNLLNYSDNHLSDDEMGILKEYYERKASMDNCIPIRNKIKAYFIEKYEKLGLMDEFRDMVNKL